MRIKLFLGFILCSISVFGQDVEGTFVDTRVLNGHSVETLKKNALEFRISHRFGDVAGTNGGVQQFFGFDQAADIRFAFEYGVTDKIMIGIGRSKGTGAPYRSLLDGFVKYKFLTQNKAKKIPVTIAWYGSTTLTYMKSSADLTTIQSFPKFSHRLAYATQLHIARKFGERISLAVIPSYVHRNLVDLDDVNDLFALGGAFNFKFTKEMGVLFEYYHSFNDPSLRLNNFNSLSAGFQYQTNGHNFKIVWTNAKGFNETQFIPYTYSDWTKGQFRLGFSISRTF